MNYPILVLRKVVTNDEPSSILFILKPRGLQRDPLWTNFGTSPSIKFSDLLQDDKDLIYHAFNVTSQTDLETIIHESETGSMSICGIDSFAHDDDVAETPAPKPTSKFAVVVEKLTQGWVNALKPGAATLAPEDVSGMIENTIAQLHDLSVAPKSSFEKKLVIKDLGVLGVSLSSVATDLEFQLLRDNIYPKLIQASNFIYAYSGLPLKTGHATFYFSANKVKALRTENNHWKASMNPTPMRKKNRTPRGGYVPPQNRGRGGRRRGNNFPQGRNNFSQNPPRTNNTSSSSQYFSGTGPHRPTRRTPVSVDPNPLMGGSAPFMTLPVGVTEDPHSLSELSTPYATEHRRIGPSMTSLPSLSEVILTPDMDVGELSTQQSVDGAVSSSPSRRLRTQHKFCGLHNTTQSPVDRHNHTLYKGESCLLDESRSRIDNVTQGFTNPEETTLQNESSKPSQASGFDEDTDEIPSLRYTSGNPRTTSKDATISILGPQRQWGMAANTGRQTLERRDSQSAQVQTRDNRLCPRNDLSGISITSDGPQKGLSPSGTVQEQHALYGLPIQDVWGRNPSDVHVQNAPNGYQLVPIYLPEIDANSTSSGSQQGYVGTQLPGRLPIYRQLPGSYRVPSQIHGIFGGQNPNWNQSQVPGFHYRFQPNDVGTSSREGHQDQKIDQGNDVTTFPHSKEMGSTNWKSGIYNSRFQYPRFDSKHNQGIGIGSSPLGKHQETPLVTEGQRGNESPFGEHQLAHIHTACHPTIGVDNRRLVHSGGSLANRQGWSDVHNVLQVEQVAEEITHQCSGTSSDNSSHKGFQSQRYDPFNQYGLNSRYCNNPTEIETQGSSLHGSSINRSAPGNGSTKHPTCHEMGVDRGQYSSRQALEITASNSGLNTETDQFLQQEVNLPSSSSDSANNQNLEATIDQIPNTRPILDIPTMVATPLERVRNRNFRDSFTRRYGDATEHLADTAHEERFMEICDLLGNPWGARLGEYMITDMNILELAEEITNGGEVKDHSSYFRCCANWMKYSDEIGVFPLPSTKEEATELVTIAAACRISKGFGASAKNFTDKLNKIFLWLRLPIAHSYIGKAIEKIVSKYGDEFVPKDPIYASDIVRFYRLPREASCSVKVAGVNSNHQNITLVLALALATFARVSELINIRLDNVIIELRRDVDEELPLELRVKSVRIKMKSPKTGARSCLYIKNGNTYHLKDHLLRHYQYMKEVQNSNYLFTTTTGKTLTRVNIDTMVLLLVHKLGRKGYFTPHSLRHGAATSASEAGIPQDKIRILGRWKLREAVLRYIEVGKAQNIIKKLGF